MDSHAAANLMWAYMTLGRVAIYDMHTIFERKK